MIVNKKAQSVLEYSLVITAVIAALVVMNFYLKESVQGKMKESSDQIGRQFDPAVLTTSWKVESRGKTTTTETRTAVKDGSGGETTTTVDKENPETITRSEHETFGTAPGEHY